ncbi:MAG: NCS1 family nucleobase:cation symporter-1, partial [Myxococcota bacterium]|nr:NCS1 family nucleobase:cation symporter-1 [Myxococcota bacterium]
MLTNPDPGLINEDIRPVPLDERHWNVMSMASLWVGMVVCVPTYMLAASLISQGMSWSQAIFTVMLGNVIVLIPMVLNGHPGTKYGIPFPVLARASWGIQGAHIPSILRALVACGWFGIQTWIGGSAIYQLLNVIVGDGLVGSDLPVLGINLAETLCFLAFWGIQLVIVYKGVESIRVLETLAAPFLIIMGLALLLWAYLKAGGFGDMLTKPSAFDVGQPKEGQFLSVFFPSLTAMVGFWATLSLNIPDFTRYAKSQRDQVLGQALGLPTTMTLFAFIGVAVTSATVTIFGEAIWDPTVLLGKMGGGFAVVVSLFALSVATLSTNIAANVVSPANVFINVSPQKVTFRMG